MLADRQTDTHTDKQTDRNTLLLYRGGVINPRKSYWFIYDRHVSLSVTRHIYRIMHRSVYTSISL